MRRTPKVKTAATAVVSMSCPREPMATGGKTHSLHAARMPKTTAAPQSDETMSCASVRVCAPSVLSKILDD